MRGPSPSSARAGQWALALLALRVLSLPALLVFVLLRGGDGLGTGLQVLDFLASALILGLWWVLLRGLLGGRAALTTSRVLVGFRLAYPWLIAYEGALWVLSSAGLLLAPRALNPLALLIYVGVWLAALVVTLFVYTESARLFPNPADMSGRARLAGLLNVASALSLGSTIMNLVPPAGLPPLTRAELIAFGLAGAVELASLLALGWALQVGMGSNTPEKEERPDWNPPK